MPMSLYPAQIDNSNSLPEVVDNFTPVMGDIFNALRSAVLSIETTLGINPNGLYGNVASRLTTLENLIALTPIIQIAGDLGGTPADPIVIGIQGNPVSNTAPGVGQAILWNGIAWIPSYVQSSGNVVFQSGTITLTSGVGTVSSGITILSATSTKVYTQLTTPSGTLGNAYKVGSLVVGGLGTGSFTITAVNTSGSTVSTDNSTLNYTILG